MTQPSAYNITQRWKYEPDTTSIMVQGTSICTQKEILWMTQPVRMPAYRYLVKNG